MTMLEIRPTAAPSTLDARATRLSLAALRIGVAFLWIENTSWKTPPHFDSLRGFTQSAVDHPSLPGYAFVVRHLVLPNFTFFAWMTLLVEATLGAFLLVGLATRLVALAGVAQAVVITLTAINSPGEWEWSYYLMILANLAIFATAAGRCYGLDALLRPQWLRSSSPWARRLVSAS